ncbi:hypothetical protein A5787_14415 [Mycobacterium sp. 852002-50816_SCH5313054-b]|uniref:PE-PPE domain-containing protein n=1 Tax=Mycobacterium sp. 852002-50816_SCH5313054-b TaxID=1834092 RepID=UPI0007FF7939|nr:PE-PPE domain-containing protein [Mycobacterium sp. 852002-50816_SCH5313054-b]OBF43665.1 hypothetical protein A5787_14415 [Mycobacterium sp. 852002-50816_SCH5313054-b]
MTTLVAQPEIFATAAQDASSIGSAINDARAAAAGSTTSLAAAAEDEVSAITAQFFGSFGQEYQALLQQAAAFHGQFSATLAAAGNAYAQTEAQIAGTLGLTGAASGLPFTAVTQAADPAVDAILIMTGSGTANPPPSYVASVSATYLKNFTSALTIPVTTAEGLYPFTGVKDLTLDISLARGVTSLNNAITGVLGPAPSAKVVSVLGYSQSSIIASMEMPNLLAQGYHSSNAFFTLLGDPANPNGGLLSRFPGLSFPSLGVSFGTSTPSNDFPTTIWSLEYDGFADFPRYPIDIFSDLNALAGIVFIHGSYPHLTQATLDTALTLGQSGNPSMTTYNMIPTENLPLLAPLRLLPVIGNPLADLIQPDLKLVVNWGYGDPNFGWSTSPADIQTPFGFLPPLSATTELVSLFPGATAQGVSAFSNDLSSLAASLPGAATSGFAQLTLPPSAALPTTPTGIIQAIESANTNIVGTLTGDFSTAYGTLLPTADIATAIAVTLPSYDVNLFLDGITQAINGDPVGGLINAFGRPIAADVGLVTLAGGFELINFVNAGETIFTGVPNPGPQ